MREIRRERQGERLCERERGCERERERERGCVRERERERERMTLMYVLEEERSRI